MAKFSENLFSITNEYSRNKKYKVITFLGIKLKIKDKSYSNLDKRLFTACDIANVEDLIYKKGTIFMHPVGVVISKKAKIGKGVKIWQNVTIGSKSYERQTDSDYPTIGDNCKLYAGAVILGGG